MRVLLLIFLLLMSNNVYGDTSFPVPNPIELGKGGESDFVFQVQNIGSSNDITCSYEIQENDGLNIKFPEETFVAAGRRASVIGSVSIPRNLDYGSYTARFCSHCLPDIEAGPGSNVRRSDCGLPINVIIVKEIPRAESEINIVGYWYVFGIIIALIVLTVVYLYKRKHK